MSRTAQGAQGVFAKPSEAPKAAKISRTSPPWQREYYGKYSAEVSAAIRTSCEAIRGGGGLSAMKRSFRWLMIPSTTASLGILLVNYVNKRNYVLIVADLLLLFLSIGVIWLVLKTFLRPAARAQAASR
jgi:hypothetical protein